MLISLRRKLAFILPILLLLPLAGCPAFTASNIPSEVTSIEGQVDMTLNNLILQKAQDLHNLGVALAQINATPGMVSVVMPAPVVAQPSPAPVTMTPTPTPPPTPVPTMPTPPTGTNPPANLP